MEKRRDEIYELARSCDTGSGVIVLTDMSGGTPSNLAISTMGKARIEVLAEVNLPMLVKLANLRSMPIDEAVRLAQAAGRKYTTVASQILMERASQSGMLARPLSRLVGADQQRAQRKQPGSKHWDRVRRLTSTAPVTGGVGRPRRERR